MPELFGQTGAPIIDLLSRAGGAIFKPKFDEKYRADLAAIDAEQNPDARMRRIAEVGHRAAADGYSLQERQALSNKADQIIDDSLKNPDRNAGIMEAARYTQLLGRTKSPMGGLTNLATIMQKGAETAYTAGPKTKETEANTAFVTGPKTRQAVTAATRNVAEAGAAGAAAGYSSARTKTEDALRGGRVALVGEQADKANIEAQQLQQPKPQKPFVRDFIENGKRVYKLIDMQGNVHDIPGEAPPKTDLGGLIVTPQGIQLAPAAGRAAQPPPPPAAPAVAAPAAAQTTDTASAAEIQQLRQMGYSDEQLRAEGLIP